MEIRVQAEQHEFTQDMGFEDFIKRQHQWKQDLSSTWTSISKADLRETLSMLNPLSLRIVIASTMRLESGGYALLIATEDSIRYQILY